MVYQVGNPGGPGRPPGQNKEREILKEMKVDPVRELILIAMKQTTTDKVRVDIFSNLMNFIHPRLKHVAVTDAEGNSFMPTLIKIVSPKDSDAEGKE